MNEGECDDGKRANYGNSGGQPPLVLRWVQTVLCGGDSLIETMTSRHASSPNFLSIFRPPARMTSLPYVLELDGTRLLHPEHTRPLLLVEDTRPFADKHGKPALFASIDDALATARDLHSWHPDITYAVRQYERDSRYVFEIAVHGTWIISKHIFASLFPDGSEKRYAEPLPSVFTPGPPIRIS